MASSNLFHFSLSPLKKNSYLLVLITKWQGKWVLWRTPFFSMKVKRHQRSNSECDMVVQQGKNIIHHLIIPQSLVIESWKHSTVASHSHTRRASIRQDFVHTSLHRFLKAHRATAAEPQTVLTLGQYRSLNSWLEWTFQNDWSYCYVLFLHFQMPVIKQNEVVFN